MVEEDVITELTSEQCWAMLGAEEFGRLAFRLVDEVHITPINYAVDGETLLFRTAEGSKLLGVVMGSDMAFFRASMASCRASARTFLAVSSSMTPPFRRTSSKSCTGSFFSHSANISRGT